MLPKHEALNIHKNALRGAAASSLVNGNIMQQMTARASHVDNRAKSAMKLHSKQQLSKTTRNTTPLGKESQYRVKNFAELINDIQDRKLIVMQTNHQVGKSLLKLEKLATDDKEMIQLQRKTIYVQQIEIQSLERKVIEIKRNYEALSYSHKLNHKTLEKINNQLQITQENLKQITQDNSDNLENWQQREKVYTGKITGLQGNLRSVMNEIRSSFAHSQPLLDRYQEQQVILKSSETQTEMIPNSFKWFNSGNASILRSQESNHHQTTSSGQDDDMRSSKTKDKLSNWAQSAFENGKEEVFRDDIGPSGHQKGKFNVAVQCQLSKPENIKALQTQITNVKYRYKQKVLEVTNLNQKFQNVDKSYLAEMEQLQKKFNVSLKEKDQQCNTQLDANLAMMEDKENASKQIQEQLKTQQLANKNLNDKIENAINKMKLESNLSAKKMALDLKQNFIKEHEEIYKNEESKKLTMQQLNDERDYLQIQILEVQEKNQSLIEELSMSESNLKSAREQIAQLKITSINLRGEIQSGKRSIAIIELAKKTEIATIKEDIKSLELKNVLCLTENKKLSDVNEDFKKRNQIYKQKNAGLKLANKLAQEETHKQKVLYEEQIVDFEGKVDFYQTKLKSTQYQLNNQIGDLKQYIEDTRQKCDSMITAERKRINWNINKATIALTEMRPFLACLSCENITADVNMLQCGHNICKSCLSKHSNMAHFRSLIRCEVCFQETLVGQINESIPNIRTIQGFITVEQCCKNLITKDSELKDINNNENSSNTGNIKLNSDESGIFDAVTKAQENESDSISPSSLSS